MADPIADEALSDFRYLLESSVVPWVGARANELAILAGSGVAGLDPEPGQTGELRGGRAFDFHNMTPRSAARQVDRIIERRGLTVDSVPGLQFVAGGPVAGGGQGGSAGNKPGAGIPAEEEMKQATPHDDSLHKASPAQLAGNGPGFVKPNPGDDKIDPGIIAPGDPDISERDPNNPNDAVYRTGPDPGSEQMGSGGAGLAPQDGGGSAQGGSGGGGLGSGGQGDQPGEFGPAPRNNYVENPPGRHLVWNNDDPIWDDGTPVYIWHDEQGRPHYAYPVPIPGSEDDAYPVPVPGPGGQVPKGTTAAPSLGAAPRAEPAAPFGIDPAPNPLPQPNPTGPRDSPDIQAPAQGTQPGQDSGFSPLSPPPDGDPLRTPPPPEPLPRPEQKAQAEPSEWEKFLEWLYSDPSFLESFIPVWGPLRQAIADGHDGNAVGLIVDLVFLVGDLLLVGAVVRDAGKLLLELGELGLPAARKALAGLAEGIGKGIDTAKNAAGDLIDGVGDKVRAGWRRLFGKGDDAAARAKQEAADQAQREADAATAAQQREAEEAWREARQRHLDRRARAEGGERLPPGRRSPQWAPSHDGFDELRVELQEIQVKFGGYRSSEPRAYGTAEFKGDDGAAMRTRASSGEDPNLERRGTQPADAAREPVDNPDRYRTKPGINRDPTDDAELKILENLRSRFKSGEANPKGEVRIVVDRVNGDDVLAGQVVCPSCKYVLEQFAEEFPGVGVEIRDMYGRILEKVEPKGK